MTFSAFTLMTAAVRQEHVEIPGAHCEITMLRPPAGGSRPELVR